MPENMKIDFSNDQISTLLSPYKVNPSADQIAMVREYMRILLKWNSLVSLTSITDPAEVIVRHFGESMFLSSVLLVEKGRLADVGSGAGFPGLALKILCKDLHVILIESNKKKCAFLSEVVRSLNLSEVEIMPTRFEDIRAESDFANFVTARALGGFPDLLRWTRKALSHRGHIILWVGSEDATKISKTPGWNWQSVARIPESQRRFILVGRPVT